MSRRRRVDVLPIPLAFVAASRKPPQSRLSTLPYHDMTICLFSESTTIKHHETALEVEQAGHLPRTDR